MTQNDQKEIFLLFSVKNVQTKGANDLCRARFQDITSGCNPSESILTTFNTAEMGTKSRRFGFVCSEFTCLYIIVQSKCFDEIKRCSAQLHS